MNITTAHEIKFRASSMGDIMSGVKKGWAVEDSLTCKRKLIKIYRELKFNRYYNFSNKYTEKGLRMEEDAITLLSLVHGHGFFKNKDRLTNDFWTGEYDLKHERRTIDIKCSWDLSTFPHPEIDKADDGYEYQGLVYNSLADCDSHTVAYCLVNAPYNLIVKEKENLYYRMGCPDDTNKDYISGLLDIEKNMIFDMKQFRRDNPNVDLIGTSGNEWEFDIPPHDRVVEFHYKRDEKKLQQMTSRVLEARSWMQSKFFKN